mmetsp:Transcript_6191/g.12244  ORF Transcript_6191/g.12244 Transcript_6191/m.12244 type:complete len:86 (+) Transcript_6191:1231-1488(+)
MSGCISLRAKMMELHSRDSRLRSTVGRTAGGIQIASCGLVVVVLLVFAVDVLVVVVDVEVDVEETETAGGAVEAEGVGEEVLLTP